MPPKLYLRQSPYVCVSSSQPQPKSPHSSLTTMKWPLSLEIISWLTNMVLWAVTYHLPMTIAATWGLWCSTTSLLTTLELISCSSPHERFPATIWLVAKGLLVNQYFNQCCVISWRPACIFWSLLHFGFQGFGRCKSDCQGSIGRWGQSGLCILLVAVCILWFSCHCGSIEA